MNTNKIISTAQTSTFNKLRNTIVKEGKDTLWETFYYIPLSEIG